MNFKDTLEKDLSCVFFNANELADKHVLGGQELDIVVESNLGAVKGYGKDQLLVSQEVYSHFKTILVKSSDFYVPNIGSILDLDGEEYYVEEADEELGVIRIVISAYES
ncbi:hypothetical protein [Lysinibacillus irui]|uniref:hypothetical protein n=1 Tax=Lysinibacillus irui TaxID=2998077 RepID=UPI002AD22EE2|nr:hypothetical protein [Lysinibacillus irui]MEA0565529.1 hypothetical protein [Lysinibacillus irui]